MTTGSVRTCLVLALALALWSAPVSNPALAASATLVVSTIADSGTGSLRAQIAAAGSGDTIAFDAALAGQTITLTSGEIPINRSLTLRGLGAGILAISGSNKSRIFNICTPCRVSPTVGMSDLTLTSGNAQGRDPGGGAILSTNATLNLTDMIFRDNSAGKHVAGTNTVGGAIDNEATANDSSLGVLTITRCTFVNNTAEGFGGAIEQRGARLTIVNSTFTGNSSPGTDGVNGFGGAIRQRLTTGPLSLTSIINSTIVGNSAQRSGGISNGGGRIILKNSIVADNTAAATGVSPDLGGPFTSQDYNWIGSTLGVVITGTATHDITGASPGLLPLADNGGSTPTMALPAGSKAIDAILPDNGCNGAQVTNDQRNAPRPFPTGANCDIGAFEFESVPLPQIPESSGSPTAVPFAT